MIYYRDESDDADNKYITSVAYIFYLQRRWTNISCNTRRAAALSQSSLRQYHLSQAKWSLSNA
jgi:hypothetical protein